jgi:3-oxoacyl-[acyl-carrier protein] reductase
MQIQIGAPSIRYPTPTNMNKPGDVMNGVQNKKVLVTGTSRGIGRAIAQEFARNGAHVFGTATSESSHSEFEGFCVADFSTRAGIQQCVEFVGEIQPDIVINNAGINSPASFESIDSDRFLEIQQVNVLAPMEICRAAIPFMVANSWGRIVNISSVWSKISKEHRAPYSASKFALDGLTLALAIEYAQHNVLANCVAPGFVDTDMTRGILGDDGIKNLLKNVPIGRLAQPDEIAKFVVWLASENNTYITGQNIAVDGGFTRA